MKQSPIIPKYLKKSAIYFGREKQGQTTHWATLADHLATRSNQMEWGANHLAKAAEQLASFAN